MTNPRMSTAQQKGTCPACGASPGEVSHQLANNQKACTNADCRVSTWIDG